MKMYLISDNIDTYMGMRLVGIEGEVLHEHSEVEAAITRVVNDPDIAVLLITEKLSALCPGLISNLKLSHIKTLVAEVPDRHGGSKAASAMEKYVNEAIGVKM